ncbi:MAG: hypothetical protein AAF108_08255 [Planctomycetota bacterium]
MKLLAVVGTVAVAASSLTGQPEKQIPDEQRTAEQPTVEYRAFDVQPLLRHAFATIEPSVRALSEVEPEAELPGVVGSAVTLRLGGRVIGRNWSLETGGFGLAAAAGGAIEEAVTTLSVRAPMARERLAIGYGPAITIDIELATQLRPIGTRSYVGVSQTLAPGLEGVVFDPGGDAGFAARAEAVFPGMIRSAGLEAGTALQGAVERSLRRPGAAGRPLAELLDELPEARVFACSAVQIAQVRASDEPTVLSRGGRIVEAVPDADHLRRFAEMLAAFLSSWPEGIATIDPVSGQAEAATLEQTLLHTTLGWLASRAFHATEGVDHDLWRPVERPKDLFGAPPALAAYLRALDGSLETDSLAALALSTDIAGLPSLLPWLGLAALEVAPEPGSVPLAPVFIELDDLIGRHRLLENDAGGPDRDLRGGIVFTRLSNPLPDWRTAAVAAWQGAALRSGKIVPPGERDAAIAARLETLRFLEQLSVSRAETHAYAVGEDAVGGVRRALWDATLTPEASCLTLIAVCETLKSLETLEIDAVGGD